MLTSQARRFGDALVDRHVVSRDLVESALDNASRTGQPFPEVIGAAADIPSADIAAAWNCSMPRREKPCGRWKG